jgi:hypothetical protein
MSGCVRLAESVSGLLYLTTLVFRSILRGRLKTDEKTINNRIRDREARGKDKIEGTTCKLKAIPSRSSML